MLARAGLWDCFTVRHCEYAFSAATPPDDDAVKSVCIFVLLSCVMSLT